MPLPRFLPFSSATQLKPLGLVVILGLSAALAGSGSQARSGTSEARAQPPVSAAAPASPNGQEAPERPLVRLKLPVRRDTVVSAAKGERDANLGGTSRLKTKGIVELSLFDIDAERLQGALIEEPILHVHWLEGDPQLRVSVSTVSAEWQEGRSTGYRSENGSASFNWARQELARWAYPGSNITAVINGQGNSRWAFSDATPPDDGGWQRIALDPRVVAARIAGLSGGFSIVDDVGSEYRRVNGEFEYRVFPNRFFASREAGADRAPFVTVAIAGSDTEPPGEVELREVDQDDLLHLSALQVPRGGESRIDLLSPSDSGGAGTLGFDVRLARSGTFDWDRAEPLPRYLIPQAGAPGEWVRLHLRDLGMDPGSAFTVGVRAVDAAGNRGPIVEGRFLAAPDVLAVELPTAPVPARTSKAGESPLLDGRKVAVIDPLDKQHPETGEMIPPRPTEYRLENHLWSSSAGVIRLTSARNEFVAFQVVVEGTAPVTAVVEWEDVQSCAPRSEVLRFIPIPSADGWLPDPLVPQASSVSSTPATTIGSTALLVDLYVPRDCAAVRVDGNLVLESAGEWLALDVEVAIWNFALPDALSFVPQMNAYGLPRPPVDLEYYRLAQRHRTCLNMVPYSWRGEVFRGYKSPSDGDWKEWDERFGPLLDGRAFADLPRGPIPVEAFYLPLNENWPAALDSGFRGGYWIEEAMTDEYRNRFVEGSRRFAEHIRERGWRETFFEFYLNNKLYHRREGWDRSSAYWVYDEPINTQDFWALRWYAEAFHEGVNQALEGRAEGRPKLAFRADVSRPEWQRDLLDGLLDVNVVGLGFPTYLRPVMDRRDESGEVVYNYGTSNRVEASNVQPAAWAIWAWSVGADGILPWKTVGKEGSWKKASPLALFYPGTGDEPGPHPSVRLKAYRRGQQDVEYLTLLASATARPRWRVGDQVRELLDFDLEVASAGSEDAGRLDFAGTDAVELWRLRQQVGGLLDRLAPGPAEPDPRLQGHAREPNALRRPAILRVADS